jgi:hypothetical protein
MLEDVIEGDGVERTFATHVLWEEPTINPEAAVARHSAVRSRLHAANDHPATLRRFKKPPFSAPGLKQARILESLETAETIKQRFKIPASQTFNSLHGGTCAGRQARFHVLAPRAGVDPNIHLAHRHSAGRTFVGVYCFSFGSHRLAPEQYHWFRRRRLRHRPIGSVIHSVFWTQEKT